MPSETETIALHLVPTAHRRLALACRSILQPSGVEVDVGLRPCSWDSARKRVQNLPFPAPILHTGQLYLPPASSLLVGKQDSRPRADKVNST
jgi:hypothetical protein